MVTNPAEGYAAFKRGMHDLGWLEEERQYRTAYADGDVNQLDAGKRTNRAERRRDRGRQRDDHARASAGDEDHPDRHEHQQCVGNRFVASLSKRVATSLALQSCKTSTGKLIGILHEVAPAARRIAIVLNESNPNYAVFWAAAQSACAALGLVALRVVANTLAQFAAASEQIVRQRSDAVVVVADPIYLNERVELQRLLLPTRLPVAYAWREQVAVGGLLSYGPDLAATVRHVAVYVDRILKGAKPADLPVEQPEI
jgi:hypothetical protein